MVHIPAKFLKNTAMRFFSYSAKTNGQTDGRTDGWTDGQTGDVSISPVPGLRRNGK